MGCGASSLSRERGSFHQKYFLVGKVGRGAFAQVHVAFSTPTPKSEAREVAVKIADVRDRQHRSLRRNEALYEEPQQVEVDQVLLKECKEEARILKKASTMGCCTKFIDFFCESGFTYIVMEKCDYSLPQWLERSPDVDEKMIRDLLYDMLCCLAGIHKLAIAHRDVKPDNFMVSLQDCEVKLCDFGMSACVPGGASEMSLEGIHGTPPFMSPEMLKKECYGVKTDVWSLGVISHVLLLGEFPYTPERQTREAMMHAIVSGADIHPTSWNVSLESVDFLKQVLCRDTETRPHAFQVIELPWFEKEEIVLPQRNQELEKLDIGQLPAHASLGGSTRVSETSQESEGLLASTGAESKDWNYHRPGSLRSNVVAARRIGAFDMRAPYARGSRNSVDDHLRLMQETFHGVTAVWAGDRRLSLLSGEASWPLEHGAHGNSPKSPKSPWLPKSFSSDSTEATNHLQPHNRKGSDVSRKSTETSLVRIPSRISNEAF